MTGVFSNVCNRLGLIASRMMTAIEPAALNCSAVTGWPFELYPTTIRSRRMRISDIYVYCARIAITSVAAVMSKPV
jgi:hypothetical protein